ncbi:MAG: N-acetyltransferase [Xanthomonadales bacterium]|nr:N-acetyltransferase [Xanthomonadales bacterium]
MGWNIISGHLVGDWVAKRLSGGYFAERSQAIGLEKNADLVAGVIYENWNHRSIMCHIAIEERITPSFLGAIFHYPYIVCEVDKIIAPVADDNEASKRLVEKMGFVEEARIKDAYVSGDMIFYTLTRDNCKYLGERYGQKCPVPAPSA